MNGRPDFIFRRRKKKPGFFVAVRRTIVAFLERHRRERSYAKGRSKMFHVKRLSFARTAAGGPFTRRGLFVIMNRLFGRKREFHACKAQGKSWLLRHWREEF
ncbi:hypothetical protein HMPREF7215_0104 [Pyramidobacter piscolens W5455]|uniref:Uncharacterized protein n=1 Tax=Pyramidobacter piscolens W5455 TaxID=352165 RepID=A0ABM9ZV90_9BACT|nr:hypothetical protein HMPREF7215_0104 [Pyramidobacter piscolens W5455]